MCCWAAGSVDSDMNTRRCCWPYAALALFIVSLVVSVAGADPLPSWNECPAKAAMIGFVERVTRAGSPDFVPPAERIATFDNDGTLWCEQPDYVQVVFAIDRLKALAPQHPEWQRQEPFASLLAGKSDQPALTLKDFEQLIDVTHAGMSTVDFERIVTDWLAAARHPRFHRPYTACIYQPMIEVLAFFRARLPDVCRLRRRRRVHASLDRQGIRHSAPADRGEHDQNRIQTAGWPPGAAAAARR